MQPKAMKQVEAASQFSLLMNTDEEVSSSYFRSTTEDEGMKSDAASASSMIPAPPRPKGTPGGQPPEESSTEQAGPAKLPRKRSMQPKVMKAVEAASQFSLLMNTDEEVSSSYFRSDTGESSHFSRAGSAVMPATRAGPEKDEAPSS